MKKHSLLTAAKVASLDKPGLYGDGLGLYLQVSVYKTKSWIFRFMINGRPRKMGLGATHTVTLSMARKKAANCRLLLLDGVDPIEHKKRTRNG